MHYSQMYQGEGCPWEVSHGLLICRGGTRGGGETDFETIIFDNRVIYFPQFKIIQDLRSRKVHSEMCTPRENAVSFFRIQN